MSKFICKRMFQMIPTFLVLTFAVFILSNMAPGSPVDVLASSIDNLTEEAYAQLEHQLGLDRPLISRYGEWLVNVGHGDLGTSTATYKNVNDMVGACVGPTLILAFAALVLAVLIALILGTAAAYRPYSVVDNIASFISFIGSSMPGFVLALVFVYIFSVKLAWFPVTGMYSSTGGNTFADLLRHLVLPSVIVAFQIVGQMIKQTRGSVLEVLNEEYVKTARAKGMTELEIIIKHCLRNALIPIVTQISLSVPYLIGGTVVIETIFSWPGLGQLLVTSINNRDYNVIMGVTVVICLLVLCVNILLDILYAFLDPRIKTSRQGGV